MAAGLKEVDGEPTLLSAKLDDALLRRFLAELGLPSECGVHSYRRSCTLYMYIYMYMSIHIHMHVHLYMYTIPVCRYMCMSLMVCFLLQIMLE